MINFRDLSNDEKIILEKELRYWLEDKVEALSNEYTFIVAAGKWKELLLTNKANARFLNNLDKRPYSIGISFGEFRKNILLINLGALDFLKEFSMKKVQITDEAEQLFLYNNPILIKSIVKIFSPISKNEKVIVLNQRNDALGIAKLLIDSENITKNDGDEIALKNLIDLGWYLRKGK